MRNTWTDARLDDFAAHTDRRFDALEHQMRDGFNRIDERLSRIDERFDRVDERFERVDERFEAMQRLMVQFSGLVIAALIGLIATQL